MGKDGFCQESTLAYKSCLGRSACLRFSFGLLIQTRKKKQYLQSMIYTSISAIILALLESRIPSPAWGLVSKRFANTGFQLTKIAFKKQTARCGKFGFGAVSDTLSDTTEPSVNFNRPITAFKR